MMILLVAILVLVFCNSVLLERVYRTLPVVELRRRAKLGHDKRAARLYAMAAYGPSLQLLLWIKGTFSAVALLIWASRTNWWLAGVAGVLISLVAISSRSGQRVSSWQLRYAALLAAPGARILELLQPLLGRPAKAIKNRHPWPQTGLYEPADLLELLRRQARQPDNRISAAQFDTIAGALDFSDKTVGDIMTPRAKVKWVLASETIGPMVMNELHKTGQTRFAVVREISKAANPEVLGTLYLQDLLDHLEDKGRIRELMHSPAIFINESQNLRQALNQFLQSGAMLLVVVNNFDEVSGVITLEDILQQIFGKLHAEVAQAEKEHGQANSSEVE
jgi:CBS domain containing-hemolysin-like protein